MTSASTSNSVCNANCQFAMPLNANAITQTNSLRYLLLHGENWNEETILLTTPMRSFTMVESHILRKQG